MTAGDLKAGLLGGVVCSVQFHVVQCPTRQVYGAEGSYGAADAGFGLADEAGVRKHSLHGQGLREGYAVPNQLKRSEKRTGAD